MSSITEAEAAWIEYRDQFVQDFNLNARRAQSRLRKREFIAGYLSAASRVRYDVQASLGRPTTCQVYDRGYLVFSGWDLSAAMVRS